MKAIEIINLMDKWAHPYLIDKWDNTGFQIGDPKKEVTKILISLDLDREILEKASDEKADMIITHHPIIFKPLKSITRLNYKEKLVYDIIREDIVVYNAHTNLDLTVNGVNDALASILNIKNTQPLNISYEDTLFKLVVFVPRTHAHVIRKVLGNEGAGFIGGYSHCTYNINGTGTFMPLEGTSPYIGDINKLEEVEETRIETIVEKKNLDRILKKVLEAHPYEEVAYDIYPLKHRGKTYGYGRIGEIIRTSLKSFLDTVKEQLKVESLIVYGNLNRDVSRVAVCGGSGASFIYDAYTKDADVYITGDVKYHDAQFANELGMTIVDAGHYHTEKVILPIIAQYIEDNTQHSVKVKLFDKSSPYYEFY